MKWLLGSLVNIVVKAYDGIIDLWKQGFGDLISNGRWLKLIVDISLICMFFVTLTLFGTNLYVSILGVAIVMSMLSKLIYFQSKSIVGDFFQPFLTIGLYAVSAAIFWYSSAITIAVAVFLMPCVTKEISDSYLSYYEDLTPVLGA